MEDWKAVTTSTDGFINMMDIGTGKIVKSYFVNKSGIIDSCPLAMQETFGCALANNQVSLFSFKTGTTIQTFNAHDDTITRILFRQKYLVTTSLDQTIKLWDL